MKGLTVVASCFLLASLPASASGTTIVAVRFPDGIVVYADSKPTYLHTGVTHTVCKIVPVRNAYVAVSGMVRDPSRQFDAEEIAAKAFESGASFEAHVRDATETIRKQARKELLRLRTEDKEQYLFVLKNNGNAVDLLFVAFERGVPKLSARRLHWNKAKLFLGISQKQDCPGADCPNGTYISTIGEVGEIKKFMAAHKNPSLDERTLRDLIARQTMVTPDDVGLPIEILSLQASGATWHENDLGCPLLR